MAVGDRLYVGSGYTPSLVEPGIGTKLSYRNGWVIGKRIENRVEILSGLSVFIFPEGTVSAIVELTGGGGGRGGFPSQTSTSTLGIMHAGGGGGYVKVGFDASTFTTLNGRTFNYSVGAGASIITSQISGDTGGNTWFGPAFANGGRGGLVENHASQIDGPGGNGGDFSATSGINGRPEHNPFLITGSNGGEGGFSAILDTTSSSYGDGSGSYLIGGGGGSVMGKMGRSHYRSALQGTGSTGDEGPESYGYGCGAPAMVTASAETTGVGSQGGTVGRIVVMYSVLIDDSGI